MRPQPVLQTDVMDEEGNLRAADIGITWENNETFLHGVRVVGPGPPRPTGMGPAMSTPYQPMGGRDRDNTPTTVRPPTSETPEVTPDPDTHIRRPTPEIRQGYHPAAPIQRFNNKSLNWPAWFRHFRAVADVHGWHKDQRALQLVSYLDETAMNVAQELGDADLYDYDVLVKLLSDRFDPASRVSAFRSRFHGRSRRHLEDADAFADVLAELCRVGYPQSPSELRQELIAEQFVMGQSDPEFKKYLWVVIRTQKDRKLQTLIEVSIWKTTVTQRQCSQWVTIPHGQTGDHQRRPGWPRYSRCSLWLDRWGTRCALSSDRQMPRDSSLEVDHLSIRIGDFVPNHELDVITRRLGVSVVDSLDTCNHVVQAQTHPYRLSQLVGSFSLMETERRRESNGKLPLDWDLTHTGLHVHHSTPIHPSCTKSSWDSSSPDTTITSIHQHQPVRPEIDASLAKQDQDQDHRETQEVSPQDIAEGMTISHSEARIT